MTREKHNQFEELIDEMMINEVAGLDTDLKSKLKGLSINKKRIGILSILDSDRGLFMKIFNTIKDNNVSKTEHIKTVVEMMREYVKVGVTEVKAFGEVMTPQSLVNDMLDTLPKDVWSNPNLRWLDPCSGCGIFACIIVERLMEGLKEFESNDELRYQHIVENMLYVGELQAKNMFLFMCAFDPEDKYALNVYNGSFLTSEFDNHMKDVWGVEKFDIVVMNPPYQEQKEGFKKTRPLWHLFVNKTINNCLIEGGYLVAVHPSGWRNFGGQFETTQKLLKANEIQYLNMNTFKDGLKVFGAKTDFDYYCLQIKQGGTNKTKVVTIDNEIEYHNLKDYDFIPSCNLDDVYKLVAKNGEEKVNILFNSSYHHQRPHMAKEKNAEFKHICLQNINVKDEISCVWYSNTKDKGHFGIPKVVFGRKSSGVFIDKDGVYGLAEDCGAIIDAVENLDKIKKALKNDFFIKNIMGFRDNLGDKYNKKIMSTFRKDFWKDFI